jgi:hypothetical protein
LVNFGFLPMGRSDNSITFYPVFMHPYLLRSAFRLPFLARVLKITHPLFLFGVNRDDRLLTGLKYFNLFVDLLKLGIAVRRVHQLGYLAVGL